ncbi:MAG: Crp/Fnr family transcriptional regulator [Gammaproteobacteria bacterium]
MEIDLTELCRTSDGIVEFAPFSIIFEENSPGDYMYVLLEGEVTVSIKGTDVWQIRKGEIFGEMALIDQRLRSATAIARTSVRAVRIDDARFLSMVQQKPYFSLHVMRVMAARLRAMDDTIS